MHESGVARATGTQPACYFETLYLNFEKEAEAALGLPPGVHSYHASRAPYRRCCGCLPTAGTVRC